MATAADLRRQADLKKQQMQAAQDRLFQSRDPSNQSKPTAQDTYDLQREIRDLGKEFKALAKTASELAKVEKELAALGKEREKMMEKQNDYYAAGRGQLAGQLGNSGVPFVGSGTNLYGAMQNGPGGSPASKAGIAAAVLGAVQEIANVAATVVQTANQRTALRGESVAANFQGDAFKAFRAETERTAVVLEKIPIVGNLLAEAFRRTAVELEAFQKKLQGVKDRSDNLAAFSPDILRAKVEGSMLRLRQRMEEAQKYGPDYARTLDEINQKEYKLNTEMADTNQGSLTEILSEIDSKFATLLQDQKDRQAAAREEAGVFGGAWAAIGGRLGELMAQQKVAAEIRKREAAKQAGLLKDIGGDVKKIAQGKAEGALDQIARIAGNINLGPEAADPAAGARNVGAPFLQQPQ